MDAQGNGKTAAPPPTISPGLWLSLSGAALVEAAYARETGYWHTSPLPALVLCELRIALLAFALGCAVFFALRFFRYGGKPIVALPISFLPVLAASASFLFGTTPAVCRAMVRSMELYASLALLGMSVANLIRGAKPSREAASSRLAWVAPFLFGVSILCIGLGGPSLPAGTPWLFVPAVIVGQAAFLLFRRAARKTASRDLRIEDEALERYRVSEREREVARMVARGSTNQEIADALFISLSTVKAHLSSIFEKTGTKNRVQMLAKLANTTSG